IRDRNVTGVQTCALPILTWFTRVEGNQEYIYVEDARYTQNNFIGIDLGEVDSVKTEITAENFFKSLEFGMEQELDYEEINGLDRSEERRVGKDCKTGW